MGPSSSTAFSLYLLFLVLCKLRKVSHLRSFSPGRFEYPAMRINRGGKSSNLGMFTGSRSLPQDLLQRLSCRLEVYEHWRFSHQTTENGGIESSIDHLRHASPTAVLEIERSTRREGEGRHLGRAPNAVAPKQPHLPAPGLHRSAGESSGNGNFALRSSKDAAFPNDTRPFPSLL